jgi:RES domain-containing protein
VKVWRLCRKRHAAFDGEGARIAGGRWNRRATAVIYTSSALSLAVLEYFVNLSSRVAPPDLVVVTADVPDALEITTVEIAGLPRSWRKYPAAEALAELGTRWALEKKTAILAVPSAVVPQERNYLLNPAHPDFRKITVGKPEPFSLDLRMWKG